MVLFRRRRSVDLPEEIKIAKDVTLYSKESREAVRLIQLKRRLEIQNMRNPNPQAEERLAQIIKEINLLSEKMRAVLKDIEENNLVELRHANQFFNLEKSSRLPIQSQSRTGISKLLGR